MRCNLHDYDIMEEGKKRGIAIGEKRGEDRGRSEAKLEAARNMIQTNLGTIEQIAAVQNLPLETVQQLAKELKTKSLQ